MSGSDASRRLLIRDAVLVFAGGAAGALLRILMDAPSWGPWMPANFLACFLMGCSSAWLQLAPPPPAFGRIWRALVHTGLLGGLSTFSALSLAAWLLHRNDALAPLTAAWLLLELLAAFFLACLAGWGIVAALLRLRRPGRRA